ncbi:DUF4955 domain-containing protein [Rubellicoccus peritrichatus]|uniref:DUF4955 domain-containing protein n=1 Tax=Rubellicoccus peritrichatus TaxID=3080537 RepID=A0AAQ3LDJ8_9BACT|nr:DUF4955 domain-containing protein [Puniceicoccus sp. CR14]WOO43407.1 DUF4955 domain-containing protein [Puniceicoccus sp. CR14]
MNFTLDPSSLKISFLLRLVAFSGLFLFASCENANRQGAYEEPSSPKADVEEEAVVEAESPSSVEILKESDRRKIPGDDTPVFESFVEAQQDGESALIPDYSYAGYHRSEKPLPEVTRDAYKYFDVTEFGANATDDRSDRDAVLRALKAAHEHSGPAVVFFPPGVYLLNEKSDLGKPPLEITGNDIVLKGSGAWKTTLRFNEAPFFGQFLLKFRSPSGKDDYWRGDRKLPGIILEQVDDFSVKVSDTHGFKPGVRVNMNANLDVSLPSTAEYFLPHEIPEGVKQRNGGKINDVFELHEVKSVEGDIVTFAEPIHLDIPYFQNIGFYAIENMITECGIEDLALVGGFYQQFKHYNASRFCEAYRMLKFDHAFNCWGRRLRIANYSNAMELWMSSFNTFTDILLEGNAGHLSISVMNGYGNLLAFVREYTDTHHGLGVARSAVGTVFLRCVQYANMEAHCGWPRATLYDLNEGGFYPRGGGARYFPHHDKGLTFWNWHVTEPGSYNFWPSTPYGSFMPPAVVGLHGEDFELIDPEKNLLVFESYGEPVEPESLFEAQLALRLGELPEWLRSASESFEAVSRHSRVRISSPKNYSQFPGGAPVSVSFEVPSGMDLDHIERVNLLASSTSLWNGFHLVPKADPKSMSMEFNPPHSGVWVLRAQLINSLGESSLSNPITLFSGSPSSLRPLPVAGASMIPGNDKQKLHADYVSKGGGHARVIPDSKTLASRKDDEAYYLFEKDYAVELQEFHERYSDEAVRPIVEKAQNVNLAKTLFDGKKRGESRGLYHYMDTMVQAWFDWPRKVNRLDIHWKNGAPAKPVRLEILTSSNYPECLYTVANDESLWEFSVGRLGETLIRESIDGEDVTTLYFPEREARAVRLLLSGVSGEVTELEFFGP